MTNYKHLSLEQADNYFRQGQISEAEIIEYLRAWNSGPHFTQAVLSDGAIRNFDPDRIKYPREIEERFGVIR